MKILIKKTTRASLKTPCLILFATEGRNSPLLLDQLDERIANLVSAARRNKEFRGQLAETLFIHNSEASGPTRILLTGLGKPTEVTLDRLRQAAAAAAALLKKKNITRAAVGEEDHPVRKTTPAQQAQAISEGLLLADYRYNRYRNNDQDSARPLEQITLLGADTKAVAMLRQGAAAAEAICAGVHLARDLVNAPGNLKSPEFLAMQAVAMAERHQIKAHLLDQTRMQHLGFGALLGVAQGSARPPYLIVLEYQGDPTGAAPLALVGKGITFDTGGISLKPADKMDEMKMDMGGAAAVIGTMLAAARLKLPLNLVAVVPAVENMPSGTAIRPGDILTSLSGKTIEVLNTDAEGRLILADALTYVARYQPRAVIDLATLTGACIIALGNQAAAILGNNDSLIDKLLKAGQHSGERLWQLPLWKEYASQIKSDFADIKNTGGRPAGTITAAAFLQKFADQYNWAHLDIAGMAWEDKGKADTPRGGTGFGVRLLIEYLRTEAEKSDS
ncbi:MAG: leucyl aminopeptidase [Pelovirga sp.]